MCYDLCEFEYNANSRIKVFQPKGFLFFYIQKYYNRKPIIRFETLSWSKESH